MSSEQTPKNVKLASGLIREKILAYQRGEIEPEELGQVAHSEDESTRRMLRILAQRERKSKILAAIRAIF